MAYELLCGRVPFEIRSEEDLYKVVLEEIHFPKSIPISDFCKDFINNCLKKQPEKRKTITELLEHIFLNENIIWVAHSEKKKHVLIFYFSMYLLNLSSRLINSSIKN